MNNFTLVLWKKALCLTLIALHFLIWLPKVSLAEPEETYPGTSEFSTEASYDSDFIYAWSLDSQKFALSEADQVLILDTLKHTINILELPTHPNLVRVIINLGFNPAGTKIFTISLLDEPEIDSTVMEIHLFSLDGTVLASQIIPNLAEANWISEDMLNLTLYNDISGEQVEIKCWNLQTGSITELPEKKIETDNRD